MEDALVATGFPSRKRHENVNVHFYYQLAMMSHGVRRAGAAALDLAYVACGRLDAFWEFGLNPWDMAAGVLLVREAGGTVSDMHGGPFSLRGPQMLADNSALHQPMLAEFAEIFAGRYRHAMPEMSHQEPGASSAVARMNGSAVDVSVIPDVLHVVLADGREVSAPLAWFPRLNEASDAQRRNWRLIGRGIGIHWPDLDEDISVESLLSIK